jgi:nucleotide-binding universal stress UspA family protein
MNATSAWPSWPVFSVVVGLGFVDADGPAFEQSARIAQRVPHGELHLVHVAPSGAPSRDLINHLRLTVNERAGAMQGLRGITIGIHLRWGRVVQGILRLATEVYADLIVLGSGGGSRLKHWLVGSTADRLVAEASCPVLVARANPKTMDLPCPGCVRSRAASGGSLWWCELHSQQAEPAQEFSYQRELPIAPHGSEVIPMGIGF